MDSNDLHKEGLNLDKGLNSDRDLNLDKGNISIEEKINSIKEQEKFKLSPQGSLEKMLYQQCEREEKRIADLNKMLDEEIKYIYSKIDKANRKWILDDFSNYIYRHNDGYLCVRIYNHKEAKELRNRLKKFKNTDKDKNIKIAVADKIDYRSARLDQDLDKDKITTLLKSWVFYSNTKVEYSKTTAYPTDFNKSLMYKIKVSGLFLVGITISIAACVAVIAAIFFTSEDLGIGEIFFFSFGGSRRDRRRKRDRNSFRGEEKKSGLSNWFSNLKENLLY